MKKQKPKPGSAEDWLMHAESDLSIAKLELSEEVLLSALCFHAQQAAEKALKAILIGNGIEISKTHNIFSIVRQLPESITFPDSLKAAYNLTKYAAVTRYPGDFDPMTKEEWRETVKIAESVVRWAQEIINKKS